MSSTGGDASTTHQATQAALQGNLQRADAAVKARRAYAKALHLDPIRPGLWGDLAEAARQAALLLASSGADPASSVITSPSHLLQQAKRALHAGLRIDPASDWLWGRMGALAVTSAGLLEQVQVQEHKHEGNGSGSSKDGSNNIGKAVAAATAEAEYCYSRALQLNPKRAEIWAQLGRLYAAHGAGESLSILSMLTCLRGGGLGMFECSMSQKNTSAFKCFVPADLNALSSSSSSGHLRLQQQIASEVLASL